MAATPRSHAGRVVWFSGRGPRTAVMWSGGSIWAAAMSWRSAWRSRAQELLFERRGGSGCARRGASIQATGSLSRAVVRDLLDGAGVAPVDVGALRSGAVRAAAEVVALAAVALEEPEGVELVVGLPDPQFGVSRSVRWRSASSARRSSARAWRAGEVVERLRDAVVLLSQLRRWSARVRARGRVRLRRGFGRGCR